MAHVPWFAVAFEGVVGLFLVAVLLWSIGEAFGRGCARDADVGELRARLKSAEMALIALVLLIPELIFFGNLLVG